MNTPATSDESALARAERHAGPISDAQLAARAIDALRDNSGALLIGGCGVMLLATFFMEWALKLGEIGGWIAGITCFIVFAVPLTVRWWTSTQRIKHVSDQIAIGDYSASVVQKCAGCVQSDDLEILDDSEIRATHEMVLHCGHPALVDVWQTWLKATHAPMRRIERRIIVDAIAENSGDLHLAGTRRQLLQVGDTSVAVVDGLRLTRLGQGRASSRT